MQMQRLIIQMAFATDLTGTAPQRAAETAMARALGQADLPAAAALGVAPEDVRTQVTLGAPDPDALDVAALEAGLPAGDAALRITRGGQCVTDPETGARQIVVTAAAEVFLPRQTGWRLRGAGSAG